MEKQLCIASKNSHKIKEIKQMVESLGYRVKSLHDFPELPVIIEDGLTFEENALKKAKILSEYLHIDTIADDSGLVVETLDGKPGIYSSRFAKEDATDKMNNELLLQRMKNKENRQAYFISVICLYKTDGTKQFFKGKLHGTIAETYKGTKGFGYDPIFIVDGTSRHLAEFNMEEKNKISHRAIALKKLIAYLKQVKMMV